MFNHFFFPFFPFFFSFFSPPTTLLGTLKPVSFLSTGCPVILNRLVRICGCVSFNYSSILQLTTQMPYKSTNFNFLSSLKTKFIAYSVRSTIRFNSRCSMLGAALHRFKIAKSDTSNMLMFTYLNLCKPYSYFVKLTNAWSSILKQPLTSRVSRLEQRATLRKKSA